MDSTGRKIKVRLENGNVIECFTGTIVKNIIKKANLPEKDISYIGALVNNEVVSLSYPLEVDSRLKLLTFIDGCGWRIYKNSLIFLLAKTCYECFPEAEFVVQHSVGSGLYCCLNFLPEGVSIQKALMVIRKKMNEQIEAKIPIIRRKLYLENAVKYFSGCGREDKTRVLHFTNSTKVVVYQCESFIELGYENVLCSNTDDLQYYDLHEYSDNGFVVLMPERNLPVRLAPYKDVPTLFNVFKHYKVWGETIGIRTVGDLNEIIVRGNFKELVRVEEAYQEKRIAEIADEIDKRKNNVKWVLIAGPSSSGKTTFAHRLSTQMQVNGITPVVISVDNYFKNREDTPLDENGEFDFENIEALDLELLNEHLLLLDHGEEIEIPVFDFKEGKRVWMGESLALGENEVAVIEGIHSLNPMMTNSLSPERKYKIYINALAQLNLDLNHRVSTTDSRLIRRIVRDHRTRGNRALATLGMWGSVRKGEEKWIFPFQEEADSIFSSALNYELAVLKPYIEPLLGEVKPWHEQYAVARRLQYFLSYFIPATKVHVPQNSLIREFVGGGIIEE